MPATSGLRCHGAKGARAPDPGAWSVRAALNGWTLAAMDATSKYLGLSSRAFQQAFQGEAAAQHRCVRTSPVPHVAGQAPAPAAGGHPVPALPGGERVWVSSSPPTQSSQSAQSPSLARAPACDLVSTRRARLASLPHHEPHPPRQPLRPGTSPPARLRILVAHHGPLGRALPLSRLFRFSHMGATPHSSIEPWHRAAPARCVSRHPVVDCRSAHDLVPARRATAPGTALPLPWSQLLTACRRRRPGPEDDSPSSIAI